MGKKVHILSKTMDDYEGQISARQKLCLGILVQALVDVGEALHKGVIPERTSLQLLFEDVPYLLLCNVLSLDPDILREQILFQIETEMEIDGLRHAYLTYLEKRWGTNAVHNPPTAGSAGSADFFPYLMGRLESLSTDILSFIRKRKPKTKLEVFYVDSWDLMQQSFGATQIPAKIKRRIAEGQLAFDFSGLLKLSANGVG